LEFHWFPLENTYLTKRAIPARFNLFTRKEGKTLSIFLKREEPRGALPSRIASSKEERKAIGVHPYSIKKSAPSGGAKPIWQLADLNCFPHFQVMSFN
jgi:hypothetical protein